MTEWQQCPFCREIVPGRARNCHHCGESLAPPTRASVLKELDDLSRVPLEGVDDLTLAYLRGVELSGAYLSGADLFGADLAAADLRGADLDGADLRRADLTGAGLQGAHLTEAVYDDYTRWPEGCDPSLSGAVCVGRKPSRP